MKWAIIYSYFSFRVSFFNALVSIITRQVWLLSVFSKKCLFIEHNVYWLSADGCKKMILLVKEHEIMGWCFQHLISWSITIGKQSTVNVHVRTFLRLSYILLSYFNESQRNKNRVMILHSEFETYMKWAETTFYSHFK